MVLIRESRRVKSVGSLTPRTPDINSQLASAFDRFSAITQYGLLRHVKTFPLSPLRVMPLQLSTTIKDERNTIKKELARWKRCLSQQKQSKWWRSLRRRIENRQWPAFGFGRFGLKNIHLLDYPFIGFPLFFFVETTIQISIAGKEPFFFFIGT